MSACIEADTVFVSDCLIVALAPKRFVICEHSGKSVFMNSTVHGRLPNLWGWVKLWWSLRHTRGHAGCEVAAFGIDQP